MQEYKAFTSLVVEVLSYFSSTSGCRKNRLHPIFTAVVSFIYMLS